MKTFWIVSGVIGGVIVIGFVGCSLFVGAVVHSASKEIAKDFPPSPVVAAVPAVSSQPSTVAPPVADAPPSRRWNWPTSYDPSPAKKQAREKFVTALFSADSKSAVFQSISGSKVVIGPDWYRATFEQKTTLLDALWLYELDLDPRCAGLTILDSDHRTIGKFVSPGVLTID